MPGRLHDEIDFASAPLPGPELHRVLAEIRAESPIAPVRWGGRTAWLISGHAELTAAFKDEDTFPAGESYRRLIEPIQGRTFESMDGAEHHLYRKLATPAFRSRAVSRFEQHGIVPLAHELVDAFASAGRADLMAVFARRFPFLVISRLLGIPRDAEERFHAWAVGLLSFDRKATAELTRTLEPVVLARRREPGEDVISALAEAEVEGRRLSVEEILSHVRLLFSAGATTVHDAIGNLVYALWTHPDALARVKAEPEERHWAIEELLRWETPVAVLPRLAPHAATWLGVDLPDDARVLFGITGANRDPAVFDAPDRFDLDRRPTRQLTFGLGSHSCPGFHLARVELAVALDVLLERLPDLRLLDAEAAQPAGTGVRGPRELPVSF